MVEGMSDWKDVVEGLGEIFERYRGVLVTHDCVVNDILHWLYRYYRDSRLEFFCENHRFVHDNIRFSDYHPPSLEGKKPCFNMREELLGFLRNNEVQYWSIVLTADFYDFPYSFLKSAIKNTYDFQKMKDSMFQFQEFFLPSKSDLNRLEPVWEQVCRINKDETYPVFYFGAGKYYGGLLHQYMEELGDVSGNFKHRYEYEGVCVDVGGKTYPLRYRYCNVLNSFKEELRALIKKSFK